jgi:hypothetical protein
VGSNQDIGLRFCSPMVKTALFVPGLSSGKLSHAAGQDRNGKFRKLSTGTGTLNL